jgi:hypothetical protein
VSGRCARWTLPMDADELSLAYGTRPVGAPVCPGDARTNPRARRSAMSYHAPRASLKQPRLWIRIPP